MYITTFPLKRSFIGDFPARLISRRYFRLPEDRGERDRWQPLLCLQVFSRRSALKLIAAKPGPSGPSGPSSPAPQVARTGGHSSQLGSWGTAFGCRICRVALLAPDPRTLGQSHLLRWRWRERERIKHDWAYLSLYDIIYHIPNLFKITTHVPTTWPIHWSLMRWELITEHSGRISPGNRTCSFLRCTSSKTNDFSIAMLYYQGVYCRSPGPYRNCHDLSGSNFATVMHMDIAFVYW